MRLHLDLKWHESRKDDRLIESMHMKRLQKGLGVADSRTEHWYYLTGKRLARNLGEALQ